MDARFMPVIADPGTVPRTRPFDHPPVALPLVGEGCPQREPSP